MLNCKNGNADFNKSDLLELKKHMKLNFLNKQKVNATQMPVLGPMFRNVLTFLQKNKSQVKNGHTYFPVSKNGGSCDYTHLSSASPLLLPPSYPPSTQHLLTTYLSPSYHRPTYHLLITFLAPTYHLPTTYLPPTYHPPTTLGTPKGSAPKVFARGPLASKMGPTLRK